jgi:hypothetical protein
MDEVTRYLPRGARRRALPAILLALAFALRVWGLADHSIWWDEGVGVWLARRPVPAILDWTAHDTHPPLHYLILRAWRALAGEGEYVWRYPSVLFGFLTVAVAYRLGRSLGGRRAGALTALFLALSRFAVLWSQEVRMYALAGLCAAGTLWFALRLWRRPGRVAWLGYVLSTAAALLSLYLTGVVPLVANLAFPVVWWRRGRPRRTLARWLGAQLAVLALVAPWLAYALPRIPTWSAKEGEVSGAFFLQLYATVLAVGASVDVDAYLPLVLLSLGALVVAVAALLARPKGAVQSGGLALLLLGLLLPPAAVYALTAQLLPVYYTPPLVPRYFLPLSVCFYALLGWGWATVARWRPFAARIGVALLLVAALTGLAGFYPGRARDDDFVTLARILEDHRRPGDAVVLYPDRAWPVFAAHYAGDWQPIPYGMPAEEGKVAGRLEPAWEGREGLWLVTTPDAQVMDPRGRVPAWLGEGAVLTRTWELGENALALYARTPSRAQTARDLAPGFEVPVPLPVSLPSGALRGYRPPLTRYQPGETARLFLYWEEPPGEELTLLLQGPEERRVVVPSVPPAGTPPTAQLVALPLPTDLEPGRYRVLLPTEEGAPEVGRFTLLPLPGASLTLPEGEVQYPLDLRLGESIELLGYDLEDPQLEAGSELKLTLYWRAEEPVTARYKVFVHLVGESFNATTGNFLWGQEDVEPVGNQLPTSSWVPGAVVADPHAVPLAEDAPPGTYTLQVGLYGLVNGKRLPVFTEEGTPVGDAVVLGTVAVR